MGKPGTAACCHCLNPSLPWLSNHPLWAPVFSPTRTCIPPLCPACARATGTRRCCSGTSGGCVAKKRLRSAVGVRHRRLLGLGHHCEQGPALLEATKPTAPPLNARRVGEEKSAYIVGSS